MDSHLSTDAARHAIRLWIGLEDVAEVMTWADELVAASPSPSMAIIDLCSAFQEPRLAVLARLRAFTSKAQEIDALRTAIPEVARQVESSAWPVEQAIERLAAIARELDPWSELFHNFILLQDSVEMAADGIFTDSQVREQFFEVVEHFARA